MECQEVSLFPSAAPPCIGLPSVPEGILRGRTWELPCSLLSPFLLPEARNCAKSQTRYLNHIAYLIFIVKYIPYLSAAVEWKHYKAKGQFTAASL